jgi:hypothetical protein
MTTPLGTLLEAQGLAAQTLALDRTQWRREARRLLGGLALAATFGLALGAGLGLQAMAANALGVPIAFVAVALIGGPAFYVALAHAGVAASALALTRAFSGGIASAGLVLAGISPTMLLLAISCESELTVAAYGVLGLAAGGCLGLRAIFQELERHHPTCGFAARLPRSAFAIFAGVLCLRVWWSVLSLLGGGL